MDELTVSEHFVRAALRGAEKKGFNTVQMLRSAGIPPDLLQGKRIRVTGTQFTRLMQVLWATMQDEFMGFAPLRSKPGTFATMCHLAIHSHTLESVYKRAQSFYGLFENPVNVVLYQEGNLARLEIESEEGLHDPDHFLQESLLVIWHRLSCWLIGQRIDLEEAFFAYPSPSHVDEYRHLFHCPLRFEQPRTGFRFFSRYLSAPVIRDEREMKHFLEKSPADLLARPDGSNSFTARIRAIIGKDFSESLPDFETIAAQLSMSPQTLRRRLREENTSFQEIKDNLRRDQAIYHLSRHDYAINEIAHLVGFTEPSTFHRAFKKWTGVTPGAYREGER
ncbi:AraC family transcriptional regulator [Mangrovitalea sediminis]|uniref:AraC family transcriptional regulator n=1 Tax=Mangrovitalea sediminis TaxID=1982043 RepID=UPI000BE5FA1D|nr:AraC family transcriptional regulator [Mangrovitalea sediminis]